MKSFASLTVRLTAIALLFAAPAVAQSGSPEIDELHRRVAIIRSQLPQITALANKYAKFLGRDGSGRFLISRRIDPAFFLEFTNRAGGPPDTQDADNPGVAGLALLPVRHWTGNGLGIASKVEELRSQARPVLIIGPAAGRPESLLGGTPFIDNGAPNGDRANASINGIANMIAAWTLYCEVVSAATRDGWQPGVLLSVLMPGATRHNARATFRMPGVTPEPIPDGSLGAQYLDAIDAILTQAAAPAHVTLIDTVAARLRALRDAGATLYAASCGHYLLEEIPRDAMSSRTLSVIPVAGSAAAPGASPSKRGDVMLWFGYGGYDCPNADVSRSFQDLGLKVVLASDHPPASPPANVIGQILLPWQLPDGIVSLPFAPARMAPVSSVDMALHYIWLRRLLTTP